MKKFLAFVVVLAITACTQTPPPPDATQAPTPTDVHDLQALVETLADGEDEIFEEVKPIITADGKVQIDWALVDSKEPQADLATYQYPITLDSNAVKNYAKAYSITDAEAQHSMVLAMASPEVLGKLLDQLQGKYKSHHLTDGADMTLVIKTAPDVVGERRDYVFADSFGRGLVLPVVIEPLIVE